jgi:tetratricopeptide (TPR) repeat protein
VSDQSVIARCLLINGRFAPLSKALLPQLSTLLPSLPNALQTFNLTEVEGVIETLLSTSQLNGSDWKIKAIKAASRIAEKFQELEYMRSRSELRKLAILRQFPFVQFEKIHDIDEIKMWNKVVHETSNTYFGDIILFEARRLIDEDELIQAYKKLDEFRPRNPEQPSRQETRVVQDVQFSKAKILRYQGRFVESEAKLEALLDVPPSGGLFNWKLYRELAFVKCELGRAESGLKILGTNPTIPLLKFARAECLLIKTLWALYASATLTLEPLSELRGLYENLMVELSGAGLVERFRRFSVSIGLAVICRLEGDFEKARIYWATVFEETQIFGWNDGYLHMIIEYSRCELELSCGLDEKARAHKLRAEEINKTHHHRQYHFTGFGSVWPDIVGRILQSKGWPKLNLADQ